MRRLWLIFAQTVTVCVALLFVVKTLKPEWLGTWPAQVGGASGVATVIEAAPGSEAQRPGSFADAARKDLAQRLKVSLDAIEIEEAKTVVWPDGSLGCPKPGLVYPQVLVDGALVRLRHGGRTYDYHSGGSRPPFLCER